MFADSSKGSRTINHVEEQPEANNSDPKKKDDPKNEEDLNSQLHDIEDGLEKSTKDTGHGSWKRNKGPKQWNDRGG